MSILWDKQLVHIEGQTTCPFWGTNSLSLLRDKQLVLFQGQPACPYWGTSSLSFWGDKQLLLWGTNSLSFLIDNLSFLRLKWLVYIESHRNNNYNTNSLSIIDDWELVLLTFILNHQDLVYTILGHIILNTVWQVITGNLSFLFWTPFIIVNNL